MNTAQSAPDPDDSATMKAFDALINAAPDAPEPAAQLPAMPIQGIPAISSLEIARITGKPHRNVTADIERILTEVEIDVQGFLHMFPDSYGRPQKGYLLPRRECDLVVSGYSAKYRLAIIDRWHELEAKQSFNIPQTLPDALRLAADLAETVQQQTKQLAIAAPKVEFYDTVTESDSVCQMAVAAQVAKLPFGRNILFQKMRQLGVFITGGERHNMPKQAYVNQGLFTVNQRTIENPKTGEPIVIHTTYATQKGIAWIIKTFGKNTQQGLA